MERIYKCVYAAAAEHVFDYGAIIIAEYAASTCGVCYMPQLMAYLLHANSKWYLLPDHPSLMAVLQGSQHFRFATKKTGNAMYQCLNR